MGGVGAFGGGGIEPDELELELIAGNGGRRGEMGEPRSVNGFESGLSASKETTALNRSASPAGSPEGFWILPERDILERQRRSDRWRWWGVGTSCNVRRSRLRGERNTSI